MNALKTRKHVWSVLRKTPNTPSPQENSTEGKEESLFTLERELRRTHLTRVEKVEKRRHTEKFRGGRFPIGLLAVEQEDSKRLETQLEAEESRNLSALEDLPRSC
ncbi:hypothetical protein L596_030010 [Steinernema carpocapsae]|uniref:Uncharacterized protein n=1 Tax=Steinernema carpocapsae TaxID=34508 RepID=A0A4U5LRH0_STECR|nr:hypothetical protein L596_030010 [Steinernema carpocapsae]